MITDYRLTDDKFEEQFQTNHLSHFLMVGRLWPLVVKAAKDAKDGFIPTVCQVSSVAAENGTPRINFEDVNAQTPKLETFGVLMAMTKMMAKTDKVARYHQSKWANIVFCKGLADRIDKSSELKGKVLSTASHPGGTKTQLASHVNSWLMNIVMRGAMVAPDGALSLISGITSPAREQGGYWGPKNQMNGPPIKTYCKNKHLDDVEERDKLWELSEKAVEETFTIY
eukprot:Filipodium_phascolosomae@DN2726_c1_g1_i20.p1